MATALEGDESKVNLRLWVPIIVGVVTLLGVVLAIGAKNQRLETVEETTKMHSNKIEELQELKIIAPRLEKSLERLEIKVDKLTEQRRR